MSDVPMPADPSSSPVPDGPGVLIGYDRAVLVEVLVFHYRRGIEGCGCGWAELGRSFPEHVADVYEQSATFTVGVPDAGT